MIQKMISHSVFVFLVTLVAVVGCSRENSDGSSGHAGESKTRVEVISAEKGDLSTCLSLTGTLAPLQDVKITTKLPGKVDKVLVQEGDRVKVGDILIQLEQDELILGLKQAEAALATAEAGLARIKAGTRKEQIIQAETGVAQAKANMDLCKISLERMSNLLKDESIPRMKYDTVKAQYDVACAQYEAAKAQLEMAKAGATVEDIAIAEAQVEQAKVGLASMKRQVENSIIKSPIDGIVVERSVDRGEVVSPPMMPGMPLLLIMKLDQVKIKVNVSEQRMSQIHNGQEVKIKIDGLPGETFTGKISRIAPMVDSRSRTVEVEINIPNPGFKLKAGMFARVSIVLEKRSAVLLVPTEAVLDRGKGKVVFLAGNGVAEERSVTVGLSDGINTEIISGLTEGDAVIVTGNQGLRSGTNILVSKE